MIPSNSNDLDSNTAEQRAALWQNLSAADLTHIDAICDRFERAFSSAPATRIESFLSDLLPLQQRLVVCELIEVECDLLAKKGLRPEAADYAKRFPQWADEVQEIVREWQVRAATATPTWSDADAQKPTAAVNTKSNLVANPHSLSSSDHLTLGQRLGPYELLDEIGRGGMGIVYRARDTMLDREIALKVLLPEAHLQGDANLRFIREAKAAAAVRHPNVVTIHAVEEIDGVACITMELINGETLESYLRKNGRLPTAEVARLGLQIASGLSAAHARGIVHRDIKPENVLLESDRQLMSAEDKSNHLHAKLTDFGLARAAMESNLTHPGLIVGTPQYMAPEQIQGIECDHRSDLFSFGAVLYRMCTGQVAFQGKSLANTLYQIVEAPAKPISELCPTVPTHLTRIIERLMAKSPDDRIQSATEVESHLRELLNSSVHLDSEISKHKSRSLLKIPGVAFTVVACLCAAAFMLIPRLLLKTREGKSSSISDGQVTEKHMVTQGYSSVTDNVSISSKTSDVLADLQTHPLFSEEFSWTRPQGLGRQINTDANEVHPTISGDGLILIFLRDGDIYEAKRRRVGLHFGSPEKLTGPISNVEVIDSPCLSRDGLTPCYASTATGNTDDNDLWICSRETFDKPFSTPVKIESTVNTQNQESTPCLSSDKLQLWFCSERAGESNRIDLYYSTRASLADPFSTPTRLASEINGGGFDFFPRLALADRVLFYTTTSFGPQQLRFSARDPQGSFSKSVKLNREINLGLVGSPAVTDDGQILVFDAKRLDRSENFDLWITRRMANSK